MLICFRASSTALPAIWYCSSAAQLEFRMSLIHEKHSSRMVATHRGLKYLNAVIIEQIMCGPAVPSLMTVRKCWR